MARQTSESRPAKFPFWVHQAVEYLTGILVVSQAIHASSVALPLVAGGGLIAIAALSDGPLAAFHVLSRRAHRVVDIAVACALVALVATVGRDSGTVAISLALATAAVLVGLSVRTDYRPRPARAPRAASPGEGRSAEELGRAAGRLAATGVRMVRAAKARRARPDR